MTSLRPHSIVYKQYKSQKSPGRQTTKEEALNFFNITKNPSMRKNHLSPSHCDPKVPKKYPIAVGPTNISQQLIEFKTFVGILDLENSGSISKHFQY